MAELTQHAGLALVALAIAATCMALAALSLVVVAVIKQIASGSSAVVNTPVACCTKPRALRVVESRVTDDGVIINASCQTCGRNFEIKS